MDPTVPKPAAMLLDFIRDTEVGSSGPESYNVIFGHNQRKLNKPITTMSLGELINMQPSFTAGFGSSASGGYQFMHATLKDLRRELGLRDSQIFDPNLQDRLAYHLLKRRGYEQFMKGDISRTEFGKRLAQEWASFPVLQTTKGRHRTVNRGETYYAGDKLNKALVTPEQIESLLDRVRAAGKSNETVTPAPTPRPEPATPVTSPNAKKTAAGVGIGAAILAILVYFLDKIF